MNGEYPELEALAGSGALEPAAQLELVIALADLVRLRHHLGALLDAATVVVGQPWNAAALGELRERCRLAGASPSALLVPGTFQSWGSDGAPGGSAESAAPTPGSTTGDPSPAKGL